MSIVEKAIRKRRQATTGQEYAETDAASAEDHGPAVDDLDTESLELSGDGVGRRQAAATLPTLTIDLARLRAYGLVPPEEYAERVANEYRSIKRPLLDRIAETAAAARSRAGHMFNRIVVTSAVPGEGKTFTTINLALSLARERDYQVVLIDGDILRPRATEALDLLDKTGFGDLLADESMPVESALVETDINGLWVMPAGRRDPLFSEHLSSRRSDQILSHLSRLRPNQIILLDSPPLLPTAEAALLAARAAQVVMVIQAGATAQHTLRLALASLRKDHDVSLLLNQVDLPRWQDYYNQYAGYYRKIEESP